MEYKKDMKWRKLKFTAEEKKQYYNSIINL